MFCLSRSPVRCYAPLCTSFTRPRIGLSSKPQVFDFLHGRKRLKTGCGAAFSEYYFTGGVFRHMLFQLLTVEGLKCSTAAVQGIQFCKISMLATQIAPSDLVSGNPRVFRHWTGSLYSQNVSRVSLRFSIWERVRFIKSSILTP